MATVQYRLSSRINNGKAEVIVRFYSGSAFSQRAKTHIYCLASAWSKEEQMPVLPRRANSDVPDITETRQKLDTLRDYIFSRWFAEQYDTYKGWLQEVVDECFSIKRNIPYRTLREVYAEYKDAKGIDIATQRQYEVLLTALERFDKKRVWRADKVTVQDIDAFCAFLRNEKVSKSVTIQRSQNTITGKLKRWRALQNFAVLRGYAPSSPFAQFTIPAEVYGTPIFLTTEERDRLYAFDDLTPALRVQRDIFIFQCHVGCRVSDLVSLTKNNVTSDGFLQYIPQKQRRRVPLTVRVPLSSVAQEILARYQDQCSGNRLLPFIHPNNYNDAIHQFMRLAGLDRVVMTPNKLTMQPEYKPLYEVVTSHTARKTFIEAMFRATKSERITSAFTGHADGSRAFSRYTDVDDDMKRSILADIESRKKD